ncbi:hypothetical protein [Metabacillus sp. Hm71]|uniref:hypothetical protein n=1 Tax=Metabacillus sp. Hm71 TaxID=3450743 RepID=UPI003F43325B
MSRPITLVYHGNIDDKPFVERSEAHLITDKIVFQRSGEDLIFREVTEVIGDEAHIYEEKPYRYLCFGILNGNGEEIAKRITGAQLAEMSFVEVIERLIS